ncbi:MAG: hypothetical protein JO154_14120 [Chitinophaga sp.]|uniref:alpha/beta fold hydrolase n=1 Tax=Chitinophaga sp. TaxID=1869181 RepID=UPI0025C11FE0|nr:hypothetical protein [Chitinophaga sp.]MBV8253741.1 hypothetical protein [Chitinophaga sp.]
MQPRFMKYLLAWLITCLTTTTFATMPADSTGFFQSFDNTRIHFTVEGKGEPIMLLHGFMQNGNAWSKYPLYDWKRTYRR